MIQKETEIVNFIYKSFYDTDLKEQKWSVIDEYMSYLDYLNDQEILVESEIKLKEHLSGDPRCPFEEEHKKHKCIVPSIIEAVKILIDSNNGLKKIDIKDRFVLQYYLAISQAKYIIS